MATITRAISAERRVRNVSNDLISRSAVIEEMNNLLKSPYVNSTQFGAERREIIGIVKKLCVEKIPTAYDVDKVVEELEKRKKYLLKVFVLSEKAEEVREKALARINEIDGIIGIVKVGGANE